MELSASGAVTGVAVVESSGAESLDRAAVAAVRGWRCAPARAGGVAVAARARQRIRFFYGEPGEVMMTQFGFAHFGQQLDPLGWMLLIALGLLSLASWTFFLS